MAVGTLEGTEARAIVGVAGEGAVLAIDNRCDEVALVVGVGHALPVDDALGRGGKGGPDGVETVFDVANLVERDGRAGVALDATSTVAGVEVTTETLGEDVGGDEDVTDLDDVEFVHDDENSDG